ncbi:hypothetical protein B1B04_10025 [Lysinibacillus sp. KCTC 33748]|uniref:DUF3995 domain-containing protein n=1 Tax=unclassified Lysinibacillus TaxID=2636778 RepID=UPI0009A6869F|nr:MULTISPECIES: DUF3995 domain-containing protein [unclassified Lysinibacillus]OXS74436.1 hypothetical protein B1B04_10025 [Lysinibacillus sp. KCTC 33748]SKB66655.1 Protein of unknown function [Lysinibacillus sp. AC-3]
MKLLLIVAIGLLWFISLLHIYWAFGGRWGSTAAIPVKEGEQKPAFTPKKWGTLFVAILIILASVIIVVQGGYLQRFQSNVLSKLGSIVCTFVFIIRALGDFKYVGFFKKIKHSQFARYDTWFYSPLCLFFGIVYIILLF